MSKNGTSIRGLLTSARRRFGASRTQLRVETLEPRMMMAGVVINEILASSSGQYIVDEDGDDSDYIELYNSSASTVDLSGWYLTDNNAQLTKWQIPSMDLDPGEYLVIFASNKNRTNPGGELHTNFALSADGEYLGLVQADGTTIEDEYAPEFPEQFTDASFGLADIYVDDVFVGQELRYFDTPTPGAENGVGLLGFVEEVSLSHAHGFYEDTFMLSMSTPTVGAQLYYSIDGSIPTPENPSAVLYTGPVEVNRSTVIRAAAHKEDFGRSPVATQTYIFLENVLTQTIDRNNPANNPFGLAYPVYLQGTHLVDYNMDPAIVSEWDDLNPENEDFGIREALLSIPSMAIVMDHEDLWDATTGIYPNADERGLDWRRAGSIEYFDPESGESFQYNTGVQMHGGTSRNPQRTRKHSFRLIFNPEFDGPGRLEFPLFDQSNFADINTVILRGGNQDSFNTATVADRFSPLAATRMRDQWMQDTFRAMGNMASEYKPVHLYINGLYWGLYHATERIDDASLSSRLGGEEEDWDIIEGLDGFVGSDAAWNAMFALARQIPSNSTTAANAIYHQLQGLNPDGTPNAALPVYLDMNNLIDFLIVHYYAGAKDWSVSNWVAARNRVDPGSGFKFFVWDQDSVLDGYFAEPNMNTPYSGQYIAQELSYLLRRSPEFRLHFADRVQMHLFNGGALSDGSASELWQDLADKIEPSIIGESARWGDARAGSSVTIKSGDPEVILPTITIDHWRTTVDGMHDYFPELHELLIERLRNAKRSATVLAPLFTELDAPLYSQFGGDVANGFELALSKPVESPVTAAIYYTVDGTDPRMIGGALNPSAILYTGPIVMLEDVQVRARILDGASWSAGVDASFGVQPPRIPGDFDDSGFVESDDHDLWEYTYGSTVTPGTRADADHDGLVTAADYVVWRKVHVPSPPDTDYNFNSIGQTYTQDFNNFRGTAETLPEFFTSTVASGTNVYRGEFDSTTDTASSFTGIKAATNNDLDYSLAWRESTGPANLADARFLFKIQNSTGEAITGFQVSYDVEAWVNGVRDNQVRFKYDIYADSTESQAAEGRQAFESDIFATPHPNHTVTTTAFVKDGKATGNRTTVTGYVDLTTLLISDAAPGLGFYGSLAPGETAYFRWQISNALITDGNRSALGIDNFSITALTGPPPGGGGTALADMNSNLGSYAVSESASESTARGVSSAAFDAALAGWRQPLSPAMPITRAVRGSRSIDPEMPTEDILLLATQTRFAKHSNWDDSSEVNRSEPDSNQSSNEQDEFFDELASCLELELI